MHLTISADIFSGIIYLNYQVGMGERRKIKKVKKGNLKNKKGKVKSIKKKIFTSFKFTIKIHDYEKLTKQKRCRLQLHIAINMTIFSKDQLF